MMALSLYPPGCVFLDRSFALASRFFNASFAMEVLA
jgi:hypothetical protein